MFWNRNKETIYAKIGPVLVNPTHPIKEYDTFLEILRDAEKYQQDDEAQIERTLLESLQIKIKDYLENKNKETPTL